MARVKLTLRAPNQEISSAGDADEADGDIPSEEPVMRQKPETIQSDLKSSMDEPEAEQNEAEVSVKEQVSEKTLTPAGDDRTKEERHAVQERVEEVVRTTFEHLLSSLSVDLTTEWRVEEGRPSLWISINGPDAASVVGPRAQTLNSVQYLFRTLVHRKASGSYDLVVDADGYRMRRRRSLENLAHKNAEKAVQNGSTVRLRAMPAHERRIIHMILREDDRVITRSVGSGRTRAITIIPNSISE
jgi:spoIIIJ-associated protein